MRDIGRYTSCVRSGRAAAIAGLCFGLLASCSPESLIGNAALPANVSDPAAAETLAGALNAYRGALMQLRTALGDSRGYVVTTGILSDELLDGARVGLPPFATSPESEDTRTLPEHVDPTTDGAALYSISTYSATQKIRGQALEALGLLHDYAPTTSPALRGHLFAVMGYSEVMLAELYCSGIPLSTLDYKGDYTLKPGSSTTDVLAHASALFDSALALSADSVRFLNLARVGKARALLDLGRYTDAAAAVSAVPDGYRYDVSYSAASAASATNFALDSVGAAWTHTVADREGLNGLPYLESGDPRTAVMATGSNQFGATMYHPNKYATNGSTPIVLADWVEARLIQAEAALQVNDASWLTILNALRTSCTDAASCPDPAPAGTAGVAGLQPLADPVDPDARVDLLFQERAFWLFLTGHRQGDLRRLIRQYDRDQSSVFPFGTYPGGVSSYGNDVTAPIPSAERVSNRQFNGCINRGA